MYERRILSEMDGQPVLFIGYRAPCYAIVAPCDPSGRPTGPERRVLRQNLTPDKFRTVMVSPFSDGPRPSPTLSRVLANKRLKEIERQFEGLGADLRRMPAPLAQAIRQEAVTAVRRMSEQHLTNEP